MPPEATTDALGFLAQHEVVHASRATGGRRVFHWSADAYPANHVSLRSVGWDNVVIIELGTDRTLAEMDFRSAHTMLHEQAIYQHEGEQYQVERFDYDNHKAYVRKVAPDYFTDAMTYVRVNVIQEDQGARHGRGAARGHGRGERHREGGGLQEDQVPHPRERGLRRRDAARDADAHHLALAHRAGDRGALACARPGPR